MKKSDIAKPRSNIQDGLFLISFLLIGADLWSVSVGGFTLRVANLTLLLCFLLWVYNRCYRQGLRQLLILLPFLVAMAISGIGSASAKGTFGYIVWTTFNIVITFFVSFTWAFWNDEKYVLERTRQIMRAIAILLLAQFAFGFTHIEIPGFRTDYGILPRPALWFYEPSYLATFFVTYLAVFMLQSLETVGEESKKNRWTLFIIFVAMVFSTSSTGFIGIAVSVVIVVATANIKTSRKAAFFIGAAIVGGVVILAVYLAFPKIVTFFIGRLFTSSISKASGGRVEAWDLSFQVFLERPLFGIGAGAYSAVTGGEASNVTFELLATMGIFGCLAFYAIPIFLLRSWRVSPVIKAFSIGSVVFLITLQANQNYLRLYYWLHIGITAGMIARHMWLKQKNAEPGKGTSIAAE